MRFQLFLARLGLALLVLAAVLAAGALIGVRLAGMSYAGGFAVMEAATGLGLLALAASAGWVVSALKRNQGAGKPTGMFAFLGSMALLAPPLHTFYDGLVSPSIHDATTDPEDPPQFVALAKARKPGMNSSVYDGSEQIHFRGETNTANYMLHTYFIVPGLTNPKVELGPPLNTEPAMFWHVFEAVKKLGWHIVDYSEKDGRIEATDKSFWFGQTTDIVIQVRQSGSGTRTDARSQNEIGKQDFGDNIARLEVLHNAL